MKATFLFAFLLLCFFSVKLKAQEVSINITEILPDAVGTDSGKEYIEIFNSTNTDINLKEWYFVNTSQSGTNKKIILPESLIKSNTYFVYSEDLSLLNIQNGISLGAAKIALYNDFGKLQLFNSTNNLVTEVTYSDSKEGASWESDGPLCNNLSIANSNTPGLKNSIYKNECYISSIPVSYPLDTLTINKIEFSTDQLTWTDTIYNYTNTPIYFRYVLDKEVPVENSVWKDSLGNILTNPYKFTSSYKDKISLEITYKSQVFKKESLGIDLHKPITNKLIISEVYPSPESPDKEWIELYNSGDQDINLKEYYIEEKSSSGITNNRYSLKDHLVKAKNYTVLYEDEFNISLNNSGDSIFILDLYGNKIDNFIYSEVDKSQSVARKLENENYSNESYKTLTPTPLADNKFPESQTSSASVEYYSINQLANLKSGTEFYTNIYTNNYSDKYIFINSDGIKLKAKLTKVIEEDFLNTYVQIKAKVISISGVKNLLINPDDITTIEYKDPQYSILTDLNQDSIGNQYSVTGTVKDIYSNRYRIEFNNQLMSVYSSNTASIKKGDTVIVNGTLDYYRNNFRLIEIERIQPEVLSTANISEPVSYSKSNNNLITYPAKDQEVSSGYYIATFGYVCISFILMTEVLKNKKQIIKSIKRAKQNLEVTLSNLNLDLKNR